MLDFAAHIPHSSVEKLDFSENGRLQLYLCVISSTFSYIVFAFSGTEG